MCTEGMLIDILDDISDQEFSTFMWHLKKESWKGTEPIKNSKLEKASRLVVVDLMTQKYELRGAVSVMAVLFTKINRNDLVNKLRKLNPQAVDEGLVPAASPNSSVDWVQMLTNVRSQLTTRISPAVLQQILDRMLEKNIMNDSELDLGQKSHGDKVREVVDMVRKKGPKASWAFITTLCELDQCLAENLNLLIK